MEKKKTEKKKVSLINAKNFMVWFFIVIMITSVAGFLITNQSPEQTVKYNNYNLYRNGNVWMTKVNGNTLPFTYLPQDLSNVKVEGLSQDIMNGKGLVYVTFDPQIEGISYVELARYELYEDLGKFYNVFVQYGVTDESKDYPLSIITCENATGYQPVIYFKMHNEKEYNETPRIFAQNDCITLEGIPSQSIMLKDRLMYHIAGVMK